MVDICSRCHINAVTLSTQIVEAIPLYSAFLRRKILEWIWTLAYSVSKVKSMFYKLWNGSKKWLLSRCKFWESIFTRNSWKLSDFFFLNPLDHFLTVLKIRILTVRIFFLYFFSGRNIRVFMFGDYQFLCSIYGITGASGM